MILGEIDSNDRSFYGLSYAYHTHNAKISIISEWASGWGRKSIARQSVGLGGRCFRIGGDASFLLELRLRFFLVLHTKVYIPCNSHYDDEDKHNVCCKICSHFIFLSCF